MTTSFKQFRFLDWKVYTDAQSLFFEVKKVVEKLPREHRFDIGSQVIRSSLSVILNLAEGSGRMSRVEMSRFLDIALGSLYETAAAIDTLQKDDRTIALPPDLMDKMSEIAKQLGGFKKSLGQQKTPKKKESTQ